MKRHPNPVPGQQFGSLVALEPEDPIRPAAFWLCRCVCGNERHYLKHNLIRGVSKSCGCVYAHGHVGTRTYGTWGSMKARCLRPSHEAFPRYGGRGITICKRWLDSFAAFLEDMGECPSNYHTLDRVDNNGNYEPGNCKWATYLEQNRNRRNHVLVTLGGVTKPLSVWVSQYKTTYSMVSRRIERGWPALLALTTPSDRGRHGIPHEMVSIS